MYSLLIETSTEQGLVALFKDQKQIFNGILPPGIQNSKHLIPEIHKGLTLNNLNVNNLSYIAVGMGPGSYTGIRVGVITARTLAFASQRPSIGLCTLQLWTPSQDGIFAVLIDAKIGGVYLISGTADHGIIHYHSKPKLCEWDKIENELKSVKVILTPKRNPLEEKLNSLYPRNTWLFEEKGPDAQHMNNLAYQHYVNQDLGELEILYLRKTQAEIERDLKNVD